MSNTKYEIMYRFAAELKQIDEESGDWDEKVRLMKKPDPADLQSGESEWNEKVRFMKVPTKEELYPGGKKPEAPKPESKPSVPNVQKPQALPQPPPQQPEPPMESDIAGESEWLDPESEYDYEEEAVRREESDIPEPDDVGYKYHPKEQPYVEYSDQEVLDLIKKDPSNVVTNLLLQRKPEYHKVDLLLPMARGIMNWMAGSGISPEEGTLLYKETNYILDLLDKMSNKSKKTMEE